VTEIGRQPWLVTGVLNTSDAVGPVAATSVATTLAMYLVIYAGLLVAYVATLYRLAAKGSVLEHVDGKAPALGQPVRA